jgi:hypothetical protein
MRIEIKILRRWLYSVLIPLLPLLASGQTINYAYHTGSEESRGMVQVNSKCFYAEHSRALPSVCDRSFNIMGIDKSGSIIFRVNIGKDPYIHNLRLAVLNNTLLCSGGTVVQYCDILKTSFTIAAVDTSGSLLWRYTIPNVVDFILPYGDGSYYFISGSDLFHYNNTVLLSKLSLTLTSIKSALVLNSGNILISYLSNGLPRLRIITPAGALVTDVLSPDQLTELREDNAGNIYGLAGTSLKKYSPSLVVVDGTSSSSFTITTYDIKNDTISTGGITSTGNLYYQVMDISFNSIYLSVSNVEGSTPTGICRTSDGMVNVVTFGTGALKRGHAFTGFFKTNLKGDLNAKNDIGISQFTFDSDIKSDNLYYFGTLSATVTVRNYGTSPVSSFHLNHYKEVSALGSPFRGMNRVFSKTILPGDSVIVATGPFEMAADGPFYLSQGALMYDLCLTTSVPDSGNDTDISNDYKCKSLLLSGAGLSGTTETDKSIIVAPNPFSSSFAVTSVEQIERIIVINSAGNIIQTVFPESKTYTIEDLIKETGLYLLQVTTPSGIIYKKIIRE